MKVSPFFYKVFATTEDSKKHRFLGAAFPVTPNGGLLTCRHVVDVSIEKNEVLAVFDNEVKRLVPISYQFVIHKLQEPGVRSSAIHCASRIGCNI